MKRYVRKCFAKICSHPINKSLVLLQFEKFNAWVKLKFQKSKNEKIQSILRKVLYRGPLMRF